MNMLSLPFLHGLKGFAPLVLRLGVGIVFLNYGLGKWNGGVEGVTGMLDGLGLPAAGILAWVLIITELVGGALLIVGLLTRFWSVGMVILLIVAILTMKAGAPIVGGEGATIALDLALMSGAAALAMMGPGSLSLDRMLGLENG